MWPPLLFLIFLCQEQVYEGSKSLSVECLAWNWMQEKENCMSYNHNSHRDTGRGKFGSESDTEEEKLCLAITTVTETLSKGAVVV